MGCFSEAIGPLQSVAPILTMSSEAEGGKSGTANTSALESKPIEMTDRHFVI
jgi:hypothetical protein